MESYKGSKRHMLLPLFFRLIHLGGRTNTAAKNIKANTGCERYVCAQRSIGIIGIKLSYLISQSGMNWSSFVKRERLRCVKSKREPSLLQWSGQRGNWSSCRWWEAVSLRRPPKRRHENKSFLLSPGSLSS